LDNVARLDTFTAAYLECAFWSSTDDEDQPMDRNYAIADLAPEALQRAIDDCAAFQAEHSDAIGDRDAQAGHDFWLTRNGHGAGFWDGDWPIVGDALTEAAKAYGAIDLYVGDDGAVYFG